MLPSRAGRARVRVPVSQPHTSGGASAPPEPAAARPADALGEHRARLLSFIRRRVRDDAAAEDIVQEVLLRAFRQIATLRGPLEPWLHRITRNAIIDHYRRSRPTDPLPDGLAAADPPDPGARAELAACVEPLLTRLPAHYREALVLTEMQGARQRDAADRLGVSLSGAKSRVQRGRAMLRDLLLQCCRLEMDARGGIMGFEAREGCRPGAEARCGGDCAPVDRE